MATADGASLSVFGIMFQLPCAAEFWHIEAPDIYVKPNRITMYIERQSRRIPAPEHPSAGGMRARLDI